MLALLLSKILFVKNGRIRGEVSKLKRIELKGIIGKIVLRDFGGKNTNGSF